MAFATRYREELETAVAREFDGLNETLKSVFFREHNEDGTHNFDPDGVVNATVQSIIDNYQASGQWWKLGPWHLNTPDEGSELQNRAILRPPDPAAGTYNDYNPPGIDTAVGMSIEPTGNITLTGIVNKDITKERLFFLRNRDSSNTITLAHEDTGSLAGYRFDLPNSEDVVVGGDQNVWLFYDSDRERWTFTITANTSGGLAGAGGAGSSNALLDGTNHTDTVAQTVSRGSIVYGNSTPKWDELVIGAANRVLRSDGTDPSWAQVDLTTDVTGVLPEANGGATLKTVSITLSEAEIEALSTSPKEVVAAQGANTVIVPVDMALIVDTTDAYTSSPTFTLRYAGRTTALTATVTMGLNGVNVVHAPHTPSAAYGPLDVTTFDARNKGLVIGLSADPTGVGAATGRVIVSYHVITGLTP